MSNYKLTSRNLEEVRTNVLSRITSVIAIIEPFKYSFIFHKIVKERTWI